MKLGALMETAQKNIFFVAVCAAVIAGLIAVSVLAEKIINRNNGNDQMDRTHAIAYCGMFGAIAMILHVLDFPVPFLAPGFYKLDFSEVPVMIGGFLLGPVGAVVIEVVKILLKLVVKGTSTAFVGDLANFVVGCAFVIPASIIYHANKTRKNALLGLVAGTLCMTVFGSMFNAIYLLPAFAELYGMPLDTILQMGAQIHPSISNVWSFAALIVAPLNLLKGILISVPTVLLYKRISGVLRSAAQNSGRARNRQRA